MLRMRRPWPYFSIRAPAGGPAFRIIQLARVRSLIQLKSLLNRNRRRRRRYRYYLSARHFSKHSAIAFYGIRKLFVKLSGIIDGVVNCYYCVVFRQQQREMRRERW